MRFHLHVLQFLNDHVEMLTKVVDKNCLFINLLTNNDHGHLERHAITMWLQSTIITIILVSISPQSACVLQRLKLQVLIIECYC